MKVFYSDDSPLVLPVGHRFPAAKYRLLRRRVESERMVPAECLRAAPAVLDEELLAVHHPNYVDRVTRGLVSEAELRRIGFPWSPELVARSRRASGATVAAARAALEEGLGVNLAGGTHHAFSDRGEGYCVFNDVAIAARAVLAERPATRILVVDCDAHQGNGTAAIFAEEERVFTFSIHDARNFPLRKERSDLDVGLESGADDAAYLGALGKALPAIFEAAAPGLVFYLAGADPFREDAFGRMKLSKEGLLERDRMVLGRCAATGAATVVVMAGGYARDIADTVDIHARTIGAAAAAFRALA